MRQNKAKTLVLVKARPHPSDKYAETVCCAGLNPDGSWARLFPIPFRRLAKDQQFHRWDWVEYGWYAAKSDKRPESRHVQENSIKILSPAKAAERQQILTGALQPSIEAAVEKGMTLALLRPTDAKFSVKKKGIVDLKKEQAAYKVAADQGNLFGTSIESLTPCPYEFRYDWVDEVGKKHTHDCGDWETGATFFKWRRQYGEAGALREMQLRFGEEYPKKGMVFALGTHSLRPKQWLLVGVMRLNPTSQISLNL